MSIRDYNIKFDERYKVIEKTLELAGKDDYYTIDYAERAVHQSYINYDCNSGCQIVQTSFDFDEVMNHKGEKEETFWESLYDTRALDELTDWNDDYFLESVKEMTQTAFVNLTKDELVGLVGERERLQETKEVDEDALEK